MKYLFFHLCPFCVKEITMGQLNPFGKRNSCIYSDIAIYSAKFTSSTTDDTVLSLSSYVRRSYCCLFPIVIARELYYDFSNRRTHTPTKRYAHKRTDGRLHPIAYAGSTYHANDTVPAVNAAIACHTCTRVSAHTAGPYGTHKHTLTENRPSLYVF